MTPSVVELIGHPELLDKETLYGLRETVAREDKSRSEEGGKAPEKKFSFLLPFTYRQTWAVIFGRFLPDSVWWFLLFWAPAFINDIYGYSSSSFTQKGMRQ